MPSFRDSRPLLGLLPAALSLLFAISLGGFESATRALSVVAGPLLLVAVAWLGAGESLDPWRLGRGARWLPWIALAWTIASWQASPVPRAGRAAVAWVALLLLLPAASARCVSDPRRRRVAAAAWAMALLTVALWALSGSALHGWTRAAQPLGHHGLLGAWLAMTLPVAATGWAEGGWVRRLSASALVAGVAALAATRSLGALGGVLVVAVVALPRLGRARHLVAGLLLLGAAAAVPRLEAIAAGRDSSTEARAVYARGAVAGASERPWLGWGPGVLPWTLAAFIHPRPGVNPPGELVGEPHSTPLRLAYEVGWPGVAVVLALVAMLVWRGMRRKIESPTLARAGELGAVAAGVTALAGSWLAVPALPVTLACVLGCALAGRPAVSARGRVPSRLVAALLLLAALALLARPTAAAFEYARALALPAGGARAAQLARAAEFDPAFPLYRAKLAWEGEGERRQRAIAALGAALDARGAAPLWLRAGAMALEAGNSGPAYRAFERVLALDPLDADAPFLMFVASQGREIDCAARALLAEPRLAAAELWRTHAKERRAALARVLDWDGIDPGWREEFVRQAAALELRAGAQVDLVASIDESVGVSASLHLFRRPPAPQTLVRIRLLRDEVAKITVPSAAVLGLSAGEAFPSTACAP